MGEGGGIGKLVRAGFWIYGQSIVNNLFGFFYWLIISRIAGSGILGLTSATIGLATLITGIISLGVPTGMMRFLGREWGKGDSEGLNRYFWSGLALVVSLSLIASLLLYVFSLFNINLFNYTPIMFKMASILVFLSIAGVANSFLTSILRTDILFMSTIVGNMLKLILGIGLVLLGYGYIGAVLGYMALSLSIAAIGLAYAVKVVGLPREINKIIIIKIIKAGVVSWLPSVVMLLGQWIGVLTIFGAVGASSTGYYYIAFTIANVVLMVGFSVIGLLLPYLSSLSDGRKRTAWSVFRLSLIITIPLLFILLLYPQVVLGLLGSEYIRASATLRVLLTAGPALFIYATVNNLVYAYGRYGDVLSLGLSQNIPRLLLYFVLVPYYGEIGAALSFVAGAYLALPIAHVIARKTGFYLKYKEILLIILIPTIIATIPYISNINWILGSSLLLLSYLAYARLKLITREDLKILLASIISREKINRMYSRYKHIIDLILPQ